MAKFRVTSPDGQKFDVTAPDDAPQEQVLSFAQQHFDQLSADRKDMERMADPTTGMDALDKARAGAGKFFADAFTGGRQLFDQVTGSSRAKELNDEVKETRARDAKLMRSGWAKAGYVTPALVTAFAPGANTVVGAGGYGAALGALQPTTEDESRLVNTGVGGALGVAGQLVGQAAGKLITNTIAERAAARAAAEAANAPRDAVVKQARQAGLVVPPASSNPGSFAGLVEGVGGKLKTEQAASAANQAKINAVIARDVGLPEGEPITREALAAVRKKAGEAYENLAQGTFTADKIYADRLTALAQQHRTLAAEVPELANKEVLALANSLAKDEFSGRTLVDVTRALREKADAAWRTGEKSAFKFYRGMADEAENLMERNLLAADSAKFNIAKASGGAYQTPKDALAAFRETRQLIAKAYGAEGALEGTSINAAKYAGYLRKGKPLTGGSRLVGEFANEFPRAARLPAKNGSQSPISPLDVGIALVKGGALGALSLGVRPSARALVLSRAIQKMSAVPSYSPPLVEQLAARAATRIADAARAALPAAKVTGDAVAAY